MENRGAPKTRNPTTTHAPRVCKHLTIVSKPWFEIPDEAKVKVRLTKMQKRVDER